MSNYVNYRIFNIFLMYYGIMYCEIQKNPGDFHRDAYFKSEKGL